jgi:hypothetical protein
MDIEIDFDVFKALTALRKSESDSYNAVIRRLLELPDPPALNALANWRDLDPVKLAKTGNALAGIVQNAISDMPNRNALLDAMGGVWLSNTHFPDGTQFRATYKGQTYLAEIRGGRWVGQDGVVRTSPSEAASAISGTNVNGWRFWFAKRPGDPGFKRMDEFKQ